MVPRVPLLLLVCFHLACTGASVRTELTGEVSLSAGRAGQALAMFPAIAGLSNVDFDDNADLKVAGLSRRSVVAASVERVRLRIISPIGGGFEFLDSLSMNVRSGDDTAKVAERLGIADVMGAAPGPELQLPVLANVNFAQQVNVAPTHFTLEGRGRAPTRDYRFEVVVNALFDVRR